MWSLRYIGASSEPDPEEIKGAGFFFFSTIGGPIRIARHVATSVSISTNTSTNLSSTELTNSITHLRGSLSMRYTFQKSYSLIRWREVKGMLNRLYCALAARMESEEGATAVEYGIMVALMLHGRAPGGLL